MARAASISRIQGIPRFVTVSRSVRPEFKLYENGRGVTSSVSAENRGPMAFEMDQLARVTAANEEEAVRMVVRALRAQNACDDARLAGEES